MSFMMRVAKPYMLVKHAVKICGKKSILPIIALVVRKIS